MKAVFRVDGGGAGLGLGHLMRCIALADAFKEAGIVSQFICRDFPKGLQVVSEHGYEIRKIPFQATLKEDLGETLNLISTAKIVVADSYAFTSAYLTQLHQDNNFVICFDDKMDRDLPVDLVIGNVYAHRDDYGSKLSPETLLLSGFDYLPLRKEFQQPLKKKTAMCIERVLVTLGGEDSSNITLKVVQALNMYPRKLHIDILLGAAYLYQSTLEKALEESKQNCFIHQNILDVRGLYQKADVAITAAGGTLWELIATGVPLIVIQSADNQALTLEYISKAKIGFSLGWYDKLNSPEIIQAVLSLEDRDYRILQSQRCQGLIDGKGIQRIMESLKKRMSLLNDS